PKESTLGGLKFNGNEQPIDKRTSYNVLGNKTVTFSDSLQVGFDISLYPETQIGYIFRIKNKESNKIYNLFFDGQGDVLKFKFNEEGENNLISAIIDKNELTDMQWFKMDITFNLLQDSIILKIHKNIYKTGNLGLPKTFSPVILFGKSDYLIDVPSFAIKNLSVGSNEKFFFSLKENEGNTVYNVSGASIGEVVNPQWLINDAYHWRHRIALKSATVAGSNYNPHRKEVYYFNCDSVHVYNVRTGQTEVKVFDTKCPIDLVLGTNFIDFSGNRLYSYEIYYEYTYNGATVASLDLDNYNWQVENFSQLPTQLHHHSSFFDSARGQYTIFGGFGSMHYSNSFISYNLKQKEWKAREDFSGDFISPRYFSSAGYLKKTNSLYIFGGMGNESGEQIVGRKYYYDLYKVDLNSGTIKLLWKIPWKNDNIVPVRGMIILNDSCFYTLCYPEHFSDSYLRLYCFSLKDGSFEILGDSIPIYSDRITTNANLYYDSTLNSLFALVQEFDDDVASGLKIYSLAFPPITAEKLSTYSKHFSVKNLVFLAPILILLVIAVLYYFLKKQNSRLRYSAQPAPLLSNPIHNEYFVKKANAVFLFGEFTIYDRNSRDITYLFSAKLKQTFCLIMQHSEEDGITSHRLSNILWSDKPAEKVKNIRGVTINHLRKVLTELKGIELVYEKGCFKFVQFPEFYCDYTRCLQLITSKTSADNNLKELINILNRGKFLKHCDDALFDSFKETLEQKLEPILMLELEKSFTAELYPLTIDIANTLFNIDPLSDKALAYQIKALQKLKMNDEAKLRFQAYALDYKKIIGSEYQGTVKV
ncbi:MAG: DNA-binding transcriptional activator, partial [Bacteroidales bacterium]|nr:DNA-binding transcriptional activator [Bacteroidales bacterium]